MRGFASVAARAVFIAGLVSASVVLSSGCASEHPPHNLLFVSLDTTRRDHLPTYGYPRATAPTLDRLAARSAVFENAVAQATITNPSHASMFTGLYPHSHSVGRNTRKLPDEFLTLAEIFLESGFRTGGFVSGFPLRSGITGIDQGFEQYDSDFKRRRSGRLTVERALAWLAGIQPEERFFLFVHLYDAHGPYDPLPEYLKLFRHHTPGRALSNIPQYQQLRTDDGRLIRSEAEYIDRYDALIRYQDDLLGELLNAVDLGRTAVVVVADHGETLSDREEFLNLNHGTSAFEEQIAIPLILYAPAIKPGHITELAETVDLLPTLTALFAIAKPEPAVLEGENLLPLLRESGDGERSPGYAFSSSRARLSWRVRGYDLQRGQWIHSVRSARWKLIVYPGTQREHLELYDLQEDPRERENAIKERPEVAQRLREALSRWVRVEPEPGVEPEMDPEDLENLRALGYLEG